MTDSSTADAEPSTKQSLTWSAIIVAVGAVIIAMLFLTEPAAMREGATKETAMLVEVTQAEHGTFQPMLTTMGNVRAAEEILLQPRVEGTVVERSPMFIPGGYVKKGDMLIQIDPADYESALEQRRSALQQAQANLQIELGRQNTARAEYKLVEESLSEEQKALVLRKPQLLDARAAVDSAQAAVKLAELDLERTTVRAPFDAQIISRDVTVGSHVSVGDTLARLVGTDTFWVEATVPIAHVQRIVLPESVEGSGARVLVRSRSAWPENTVREGHIISLIGELENQTRMARVLISVEDPLNLHSKAEDIPQLILGSFVEARIETRPFEDVYRVSRDYIRKNDTIWIMEEDRLQIRNVTIDFMDQNFAYISEGLSEGERIVTSNLATVVDGAKLRLGAETASADEARAE